MAAEPPAVPCHAASVADELAWLSRVIEARLRHFLTGESAPFEAEAPPKPAPGSALAELVRAGPLDPTLFGALWIGAVGGLIVVLTVPMLDRMKIDDVVGAIPVHLFAGVWGTLAVPFYTSGASFVTQAVGIVAIGVFVFVASAIVWIILNGLIGLRVTEEEEVDGLDMAEIGMEAYPEFAKG